MNTFLAKLLIRSERRSQKTREAERMACGRNLLFSEGVVSLCDIPYLNDADPRHTLDVISPVEGGILPVILEVHGGGYVACEKNINRLHCRAYAQQGFRVVNMDYTLIPEGDFTVMLREIAAVLEWISANADAYGFDTGHVYLSGDSAGGHLVLLWSLLQGSPSMQEYFGIRPGSITVRAAAPTCPAFTFSYKTEDPKDKLNGLFMLVFPHGADCRLLEMLDVPSQLPHKEFPPLFITTTPLDNLLYSQDLVLERALAATGRDYCFHSYESKGSPLGHVFNVLFPEYPESAEANADICAFFRAH